MNNIQKDGKPEILLVDDTPEHIEASVAMLQKNNYKVRIATKGHTALKLIEMHPPDLILLDVYMPEMDGFEVCRKIKDNRDFSSIPIIFLTASNDEESVKKGFALGAQDYVVKPFNISELLARVKTHIQLKRQTESLREANRELDSFCLTVSHDLKAPLLSVNKLIEYFIADYGENVDGGGQELLATIREKSVEVVGIVDHLLKFSKMCEMQINKEPVRLNEIFDEAYRELLRQEPARQISFRAKELPVINGDAVMIRLLVSNILSNALKYTRKRELAVIEVTASESDYEYVISVNDNGVGFDMNYSSRLFGVFQRLHSQNEFEGSGIGLAICQRILKRHNGRAWMTGEVNRGASFYFALPKDDTI